MNRQRPKLSFAEVSALLSSVHTQSSIKATPLQIQSIANEMCLCKDCLELTEDANYSDKGSKILKSYENTHQDFNFEITKGAEQQNEVWSLVLNGDIVLKRKGDQSVLLEDFVTIINNWQEANQKPSCLSMVDNQQSDSGYHQEGEKFDSNQWSHSNPSHYSYSSSPNAGYEDPQQGYIDLGMVVVMVTRSLEIWGMGKEDVAMDTTSIIIEVFRGELI